MRVVATQESRHRRQERLRPEFPHASGAGPANRRVSNCRRAIFAVRARQQVRAL